MSLKLDRLKRFRAGVPGAVDQAADDTADDFVELAQQFAPVDEGDLQGSVRKEDIGVPGVRLVKAGGPDAPHAVYVEEGTRISPAQPYWEPTKKAIDRKLRFQQRLQELMEKSR